MALRRTLNQFLTIDRCGKNGDLPTFIYAGPMFEHNLSRGKSTGPAMLAFEGFRAS
jgi:hypothetical protein